MSLYQVLACTIQKYQKISKTDIKAINLKYQLPHGMKILNYLTNLTLYQILKIILSISLKKMKNLPIILR